MHDNTQARQRLRDMAELMKGYGWRVPEAQRAHLIMVEENMTVLENGVQVSAPYLARESGPLQCIAAGGKLCTKRRGHRFVA